MTRSLKALLLATAMTAVATVPAATVMTLASVDAAFAKNGNGNGGGGNGGGNGKGGGNGGGKGNSAGKGAEKSASNRGIGNGNKGRGGGKAFEDTQLGTFVGKLFGNGQKARGAARQTATAPARGSDGASVARASVKDDPMHPSNLGNGNAMLKASPQAIAAHIANGNTKGPIGAMAALAVADANVAGAGDTLALAEEFTALGEALDALGYGSVSDYYGDLDAGLADEIAGIGELLGAEEIDADALDQAIAESRFDSLADYEAAVADLGTLDGAITTLGGDTETRADITETAPTEEEIAEAGEAIAELGLAETNALAVWNKNPDSDPETITDAEAGFLELLRERLAADGAIIDDALTTPEDEIAADDDLAMATE